MKRKPDPAHARTDRELAALEKRITYNKEEGAFMEMNECLRVCPFCGALAKIEDVKQVKTGKPQFAAVCQKCGCRGRAFKPFTTTGKHAAQCAKEAIDKAIMSWNTRI